MTGSSPAPRRHRWTWLVSWPVRVAVILAVFAILVWRRPWDGVERVFALDSWGMLSLAVLANFGSVAMTGLVWKSIIDGLPQVTRRTRPLDVFSPLMVGFLFNTILAARVGEFAKVFLLRKRLAGYEMNARTTTLLGTVLVANLFTTVAWVMTVAVIGLFLPLPRYAWFVTVVIGLVCVTVITLAVRLGPQVRIPEWLHGDQIWLRVQRAVARFWGAVKESHLALRDPRQTSLLAAGAAGVWLFQWMGIYFTLRAFGLERVGLAGAGLLLVTVTVVQIFPLLPGNVGLFQLGVFVPLTQSYGVSSGTALGFSIVLQVAEAVIGVALGFAFLLYEGVDFRELRRQAEDESDSSYAGEVPAPPD